MFQVVAQDLILLSYRRRGIVISKVLAQCYTKALGPNCYVGHAMQQPMNESRRQKGQSLSHRKSDLAQGL